jgi:peptide/nickel transport system permease protein
MSVKAVGADARGAMIQTPARQAMRRLRKNKLAIVGGITLALLILLVVFGPLLSSYNPTGISLGEKLKGPSLKHPLGTDTLGRDLLTRLMHGGRISLAIGLASALLAMSFGTLVGVLAGYYGGIVDSLLMRVTDLVLTIPTLPLLMVMGAMFNPSPTLLVVMISVFNWTTTARLVRSQFLVLRTLDYARSARAVGCSNFRLIFHHLLPNAIGAIVVTATLTVGRAIIFESTMSYLGVGINPPTASWGNMLQDAQRTMSQSPITAIAPGVFILLTVLAINFLGDGLDDALAPKRS